MFLKPFMTVSKQSFVQGPLATTSKEHFFNIFSKNSEASLENIEEMFP